MKLTDEQVEALARAFRLERTYARGEITDDAYRATAEPIYAALNGVMDAIDPVVLNGGLTADYLGALADDPVALRAWLEQI